MDFQRNKKSWARLLLSALLTLNLAMPMLAISQGAWANKEMPDWVSKEDAKRKISGTGKKIYEVVKSLGMVLGVLAICVGAYQLFTTNVMLGVKIMGFSIAGMLVLVSPGMIMDLMD